MGLIGLGVRYVLPSLLSTVFILINRLSLWPNRESVWLYVNLHLHPGLLIVRASMVKGKGKQPEYSSYNESFQPLVMRHPRKYIHVCGSNCIQWIQRRNLFHRGYWKSGKICRFGLFCDTSFVLSLGISKLFMMACLPWKVLDTRYERIKVKDLKE